jgi:hypothetical protein
VAILGGQSGLSGGYTQDGYTVEASSEFSAIHAASNVFNHIQAYQTTDHAWLSGTNTYGLTDGLASSGTSKDTFQDVDGSWLGITLPTGIRLSHIHIYNRFDNANSVRPPKTGIIWASNDGTSWYNIFNFDNLQDTDGTLNVLHVNNTNFYTRYRVQITAMHNDPQKTSVAVGELEFYGHEEGSGSLDTTLKSVYNVPATTGTQLEVYYDAKDYTGVTSMVNDKAGTATNATISNAGGTITFNDEYKAWTFGGDTTRTDTFTSPISSSIQGNIPLSASLWFKTSELNSGSLISLAPSTGEATNQVFGVRLDSSTETDFSFLFWNNDIRYSIPENTLIKDNWYHLTATYDGTNRNLYVNGVRLTVVSTFGANLYDDLALPSSNLQLQLGRRNNGDNEFFGSIANFRLFSKALNAGQVQELYDYQKDYFLGSKSQVTLYKGHLGVGVTEPSGQLELAGDERIQEYPPRAMTGYETLVEGHGVFCVSASSQYNSSYAPWKAFRKFWDTDDQSWASYNETVTKETGLPSSTAANFQGILGNWIQLKLPYKIDLHSFKFESRDNVNYAPEELPGAGIVYGSNDEVTWDIVHSFSGVDYGGVSGTLRPVFTVKSNTSYSIFRLLVTKNYLTRSSGTSDLRWAGMGAWRLFGTPGPTTLDKGSLTLGRSLDVPRVSRYDVDTETPRYEKLVVDFDTTVNSSPTDISGKGNHGTFYNGASYSPADKAFNFDGTDDSIRGIISNPAGDWVHSISFWFKLGIDQSTISGRIDPFTIGRQGTGGVSRTTNLPDGDLAGHYSSCDITPTAINWYFYGNDASFNISGIKANEWHHLTFAYEGGGAVANRHAYFDGVEYPNVGTSTAELEMFANSILALGVDFGRVSSSPSYFNGQLSNFKIYNAFLEPSEVKKLYKLGRTGRSMVISDTAVGIGKVPEAQLDVRGVVSIDNIIPRGYLQLNQGIRPADSSATHGMRWTNTDNANHWHLFNSDNDHFRFVYNGAAKGWVDPNDPNAQMNFTGQHRTFIKDVPFSQVGELEGLIVSSDQNKYIKMSGGIEVGSNAITTNESLPVVSLSNVVTDKKCFGVISASEDPEKREEMYGNFGSVFEKEKGDTRVYINSVGEGAIWVTDINGSLESGDYITTSNVAGYGQKQDGAGLMNYTVAKITMDCDFEPVTQSVQIIKKDEHGENVLDVHGQIQWGDDPSGATEKAYKIRYLDANGNITDEANHVHKAAFVGCTYHCG